MAYTRYEQYDIYSQIFQEPLQKDHQLLLLAQGIGWDEITDRLVPFYGKPGPADAAKRSSLYPQT